MRKWIYLVSFGTVLGCSTLHYSEWVILYNRLPTFFRKYKNYWKCFWKCHSWQCWCSGLYLNISHQAGLKALKEAFEKRDIKKIPTEDLVKMTEFVLNNNIFEFNSKEYQQKSGTAIGTKFAPSYACIYMYEVEQKFLETQSKRPLIWLRYLDNIFLFGLMVNRN